MEALSSQFSTFILCVVVIDVIVFIWPENKTKMRSPSKQQNIGMRLHEQVVTEKRIVEKLLHEMLNTIFDVQIFFDR